MSSGRVVCEEILLGTLSTVPDVLKWMTLDSNLSSFLNVAYFSVSEVQTSRSADQLVDLHVGTVCSDRITEKIAQIIVARVLRLVKIDTCIWVSKKT